MTNIQMTNRKRQNFNEHFLKRRCFFSSLYGVHFSDYSAVLIIFFKSIKIWNDYLLPSLVINQEGMYTFPLQMYYFFGEYTIQWELALAGLVLSIIPVILLYMFLQRYIIDGVTEEAVK